VYSITFRSIFFSASSDATEYGCQAGDVKMIYFSSLTFCLFSIGTSLRIGEAGITLAFSEIFGMIFFF